MAQDIIFQDTGAPAAGQAGDDKVTLLTKEGLEKLKKN